MHNPLSFYYKSKLTSLKNTDLENKVHRLIFGILRYYACTRLQMKIFETDIVS